VATRKDKALVMIRSVITPPVTRGWSGHRRVELFNMPFDVVTFADAVDLLVELAKGDRPAYAVTANVDHAVRFHRSPAVRHLYTQADLVLADGMPLVWASRLLGTPLPERVAGSDLLPALCAKAAEHDLSVFLLGGAPTTAQRAAQILRARHPRLRVAGTCCPDHGFEREPLESARIVDAVRIAQPDILFVGLGSPKQEKWIFSNRVACGANLSIGVGISFSFVAQDVIRAPRWMQRAGLEWFHRLTQEPRRLSKRYLVKDAIFLPLFLKHLCKRGRASRKPRVEHGASHRAKTRV
jgi:N-acetylglucosaminyldiphosphoundecaprenol N-acetyl-beta-D-mannosaminyltransferase